MSLARNISVGGILIALTGMSYVHREQTASLSTYRAKASAQREKADAALEGTLLLERYRRQSKDFRKLSDTEINGVKAKLKAGLGDASARVEKLDATEAERASARKLVSQLGDFLALSAKLEPTLFLRDIYSKPEARTAHDAMLATLGSLKSSASVGAATAQAALETRLSRLDLFFYAFAAAALVFLLSIPLISHAAYAVPLRRLLRRAHELEGSGAGKGGAHAQITGALEELSRRVQTQQGERRAFVQAIAGELRTKGESELAEWLELEEGRELKLDERLVDLRELTRSACEELERRDPSHVWKAVLPAEPLPALVDTSRLVAGLTRLGQKLSLQAPTGGGFRLELVRAFRAGAPAGIEIRISDVHRPTNGARGPVSDLLVHWISMNGFALRLAERVVRRP